MHNDRRQRILIVEDEPLIALDLETILETHGFQPIGPASSVEDASKIVATERIDAALVDYLLNDGEALPLADLLVEKEIPFALCTGSDLKDFGDRYPCTPVLSKPFKADDVRDVLGGLLADRSRA